MIDKFAPAPHQHHDVARLDRPPASLKLVLSGDQPVNMLGHLVRQPGGAAAHRLLLERWFPAVDLLLGFGGLAGPQLNPTAVSEPSHHMNNLLTLKRQVAARFGQGKDRVYRLEHGRGRTEGLNKR